MKETVHLYFIGVFDSFNRGFFYNEKRKIFRHGNKGVERSK